MRGQRAMLGTPVPNARRRSTEANAAAPPERPGRLPPGSCPVQPNFNDYVQPALLSGLIVASMDTNTLLRKAEYDRQLQRWERVVRYRFPSIRDPLEIESAAAGLMSWDQTESAAWKRRGRGEHLPQKADAGLATCVILAAFAMMTVGTAVWTFFVLAGMVAYTVVADAEQPGDPWFWGLLGAWVVYWAYIILDSLWKALVPGKPTYDPTSDSDLCRRFPPGSEVRTIEGEVFTATDWPVYIPGKLDFWVPVDRATPSTTYQWGVPTISSAQAVWA